MKWSQAGSRRGPAMTVGALCLLSFVAVLVSTRHGAGISPDSAAYVGTARNLAAGRGLVSFDDSALTMFPPGFPMILSAGNLFGVDAATVARWLGAAVFAVEIFLAFVMVRRHVRAAWVAVASAAAVAVSPMALRVSGMAWSEPVFVVVVLGLLIVLEDWMRAERLRLLAAAVALSWLGFLLRYSGIALAAVSLTVVTLAWLQQRGLKKSIGRIALLAGALGAVPLAWALRNIAEGTGAFGDRVPSHRGVLTNIGQTIDTMSTWVLPSSLPVAVRIVALAGVVLGGSAIAWRRWGKATDRSADASPEHDGSATRPSLIPIFVYVVVYLVVVIASASATSINGLDERLLYPLFVPLVILVACTADSVFSNARLNSRIRTVLVLGFSAWLVLQTGLFVKAVHERERDGIGFADLSWQRSPLVRDVQDLPRTARLFSNLPEPISYLTRRTVRFGPPRGLPDAVDLRTEPGRLLRDVRCGRPTYLIWFTGSSTGRSFVMPPSLLARRVALEPQAREGDGVLYRVRSLTAPSGEAGAADGVCSDGPPR